MTITATKRAVTVGAALALTATALIGSPAASATAAGTLCTPTTRTIDTLTYATPIALSPRGHVVADEGDPGAISALWLHRPGGTKTTITFADGSRPEWPSDVSARGVTVGTEGVRYTPIEPVLAWASQGSDAALLPMPTRVEPVVHGPERQQQRRRGRRRHQLSQQPPRQDRLPRRTDRVAKAGQRSPRASHANWRLRGGVRQQQAADQHPARWHGVGRPRRLQRRWPLLARWRPGAADPILDLLPADSDPVAVAGRWVVGRPFNGGTTTVGDMSGGPPRARSDSVSRSAGSADMGIAADGTYFGTVTVQGIGGGGSRCTPSWVAGRRNLVRSETSDSRWMSRERRTDCCSSTHRAPPVW